jgi:hypothetical protein
LQTLEPSEEDQLLIVDGDNEEVMKETCPQELLSVQEEDVRAPVHRESKDTHTL